MPEQQTASRYRFGVFEVDAASGELRRQGLRIKLHSQPFQILVMLIERPGEILSREDICQCLWPEGTFVDFDHGLNSAMNRLREALGDKAASPRYVETLARRGYRFLAAVERISEETSLTAAALPEIQLPSSGRVLAAAEDLPKTSHAIVQALFMLLQIMYVSFYVATLFNLTEIESLYATLSFTAAALPLTIATAAILIPVRTFLVCAALFHAPGIRDKFLKMWWFLLPLDAAWALAPFLLSQHIGYGPALACTTLLVYSPFAQRSLILMGAGQLASHQPR